jgi:phosphoserine phosphatase
MMSATRTKQLSEKPTLIVDLDGTLVLTNTLTESILLAARRPWQLGWGLFLASWLGKAAMKQHIAAAVDLKPELLPYNEELLSLLRIEAVSGRSLILATGADRNIASAVADHLGIFDAVLASDGKLNLTGATKLRAIRETIGDRPFSYVGNHLKDLPIWREAQSGIVVNAPAFVERKAVKATRIEAALAPRTSLLKGLLRAIRPYQWAKNLLVFVPIITARAIDDLAAWGLAILMFVGFSAVASGTYLLNDLLDLAADRQHSRKRTRPFASGSLPLHVGLIATPLLLLAGVGLGQVTGTLPIALLYVFISMAYIFYLKSQPLVDVFLLATLYTLRLFGGGIATGYHVTLWLLAFASFLFLSLGIVKRVSELMTVSPQGGERACRAGLRAERQRNFADDRRSLQFRVQHSLSSLHSDWTRCACGPGGRFFFSRFSGHPLAGHSSAILSWPRRPEWTMRIFSLRKIAAGSHGGSRSLSALSVSSSGRYLRPICTSSVAKMGQKSSFLNSEAARRPAVQPPALRSLPPMAPA